MKNVNSKNLAVYTKTSLMIFLLELDTELANEHLDFNIKQ